MFPHQKKTDLIAAVTLLCPVWDFAEHIKKSIDSNEFSDTELEELHAIVMSAINSVTHADREAVFSAMSEKINHLKHHEAAVRNQEQDQAHTLLQTI